MNIDIEKQVFYTDDGIQYPFIFKVENCITIDILQKLIDECEEYIKLLIN